MADYLIAQDNEDGQVLRVDYSGRYVQNLSHDWQFLFNANSVLTPTVLVLKNTGQFDTSDLESIKIIGYLYNAATGGIAAGSTCTFNIYYVSGSTWTETSLGSVSGTLLSNNYFFADINVASLVPADLDGDTTLMIECVLTRLSSTYRERVYLNHLGSYDSIVRLRQDVDFLDITKLDE